MRIKNLKPYYLKRREILRDGKEGGRRKTFAPDPAQIKAYIYDDIQNCQTEMHGIRQIREKIMLLDAPALQCVRDGETGVERYLFRNGGETTSIAPGDGVCIYVDPAADPDYQIASIVQEGHLVCRLEKI